MNRYAIFLLLLSWCGPLRADLMLTGLHTMGTTATGDSLSPTGGASTSVPNGGNYVLWTALGGINAPFINGPSRNDAAISFAMTPGSYTFYVFGETGFSEGQSVWPGPIPQFVGLNLFFGGELNTPRISVFAPMNFSTAGPFPAFSPNPGTTVNLPGRAYVNAAGTLGFTSGDIRVALTDFVFSAPTVYNVDRIANFDAIPDGNREFVGWFALDVQRMPVPVPEPSTVTLMLAVGIWCGTTWGRRRRRQ